MPDWLKIRAEYEKGILTPKEVAEKFNVAYGTLRQRKSREKWKENNQTPGVKAFIKTVTKDAATPSDNEKQKKIVTLKNKSVTNCEVIPAPVFEEEVQAVESSQLTEKEKEFCLFYIRSFNASTAAVRAGYSVNSAATIGYELLTKPHIRAEILRLKEIRRKSLLVSKDDIIERHMRIAFSDLSDVVKFGKIRIPLLDAKGNVIKDEKGEPRTYEINYVDVEDHTKVDGTLIAEVRKTQHGIAIKTHDPQKSLDWLSTYFEMNPNDKHRWAFEKAKLNLDKERLDLERQKVNGPQVPPDGEGSGDNFIEALNGKAGGAWDDYQEPVSETPEGDENDSSEA